MECGGSGKDCTAFLKSVLGSFESMHLPSYFTVCSSRSFDSKSISHFVANVYIQMCFCPCIVFPNNYCKCCRWLLTPRPPSQCCHHVGINLRNEVFGSAL